MELDKKQRAARQRFQRAKDRWTRAAVRVWKNEPGAEKFVDAALRELNAARRALAAAFVAEAAL